VLAVWLFGRKKFIHTALQKQEEEVQE